MIQVTSTVTVTIWILADTVTDIGVFTGPISGDIVTPDIVSHVTISGFSCDPGPGYRVMSDETPAISGYIIS